MYVLRLHNLSMLLLKAHAIKEHNASIWFQNNVVDWSTFCFLCSSQCSASYPQHSQPSSWTSFGSTRTTNFCIDDSDSAGTRNLASSTQLPCLSSVTFSCRFNAFARFLFPQGLIKIFREKKTHSLAIPSRARWCPSVVHDEEAHVIVESSNNPEENLHNDNNLEEIWITYSRYREGFGRP